MRDQAEPWPVESAAHDALLAGQILGEWDALPKTRIRGFDFSGTSTAQPSPFVAETAVRTSADSCSELASDLVGFLSEDPVGTDILGSRYDYTLNRPVYLRDPSGLRVWVCNRGARNPPVGNHAYFWDDKAHRACSMQSSSGSGGTSSTEGGPGVDACVALPTTPGQDYAIMRCCEATANSGVWFPGVNDCHNAAQNCLANVGLGAIDIPGGRSGSCSSCWNPAGSPPAPPGGWPLPPWSSIQ